MKIVVCIICDYVGSVVGDICFYIVWIMDNKFCEFFVFIYESINVNIGYFVEF